jgi:hypothetical protein
MSNIKVKDCLFGQIRNCKDAFTIPAGLREIITKQQIITWDNVTGMNPMYYNTPSGTIYVSYKKMLEESKLSSMKSLTINNSTLNTATSPEVLVAKILGQWWHIYQLMNLPDALDYDYTVFRQTDTYYRRNADEQFFNEHVISRLKQMTKGKNNLPAIFNAIELQTDKWPSQLQPKSSWWIINRRGLEILQHKFYDYIEQEIEYYQNNIGFSCQQIQGRPAYILSKIAIKNNFELVGFRTSLVHQFPSDPADDYTRLNRIKQ